ncbi:MAG: hypothetical protein NT120_04930 [Candidatus Aenigmarchaeota archaeon]|nr:hypothetical protein [Candidatus Aenigmarchaeota archaeon]
MEAKSIQKNIIMLIILAIGVKILTMVSKGYTANLQVPGNIGELANSVESLSNLLLIGIVVIIIILIPIYLAKRSEEKKYGQQPK